MRFTFSLPAVLIASLLVVGNLATGQETDKEKAAKLDLEKLQGEWRLVRCETDGSNLDIGPAKLVIQQNSYVLTIGPGADKGRSSLNPLDKPKSWDATSNGEKEAVPAIYELNGNRLRFAYRQDKKRPASIFGKRGSGQGHVLYVFERGDGKLEKAEEEPKKDFPKLVVAAEKTPYRQEIKLATGDVLIVVLPDKKEVLLWADKGNSKSGAYCWWERESYIEQGAVIYAGDKTTEHELFVGDWHLSYVNDLVSSPKLTVTVSVKKREKGK
jgi:uncharacterized protein (TIGR03067 family)